MGFKCGIVSLITLLFIPVSLGDTVSVTCYPQTICTLREATMEIKCSYSNIDTTTFFWFSPKQKDKWRNEDHPEDLVLDSDYAGRVSYTEITKSSSALRISDLRERDSGEYHVMLFTGTGEKYHSSTMVNLTVSDLWVTPSFRKGQKAVTCRTSCPLSFIRDRYWWSKNGRYTQKYTDGSNALGLSSSDEGSYTCCAIGFQTIYSNPVCVSDKTCRSVSYTDRRVCVVEGSSVEFPCTYSHPSDEEVEDTFWFYVRPKEDPQDLSLEEQFAGRVEFVGDKERNCTLRIRDLRKSDSGEYRFRFSTKQEQIFIGEAGVNLMVTDLQVRVSSTPVSEGQTVTLSCSTTCTLPFNPTYIWYKNGQPVTHNPTKHNKLYLESADSGNGLQYSCALGGPEGRTELKHITVGVAVCLGVILITGVLWMWCVIRRKRRADTHTDIQIPPNSTDDTYTDLNPSNMSSDYNTLTSVTGTYASLNPANMTTDYDSLRHVTGTYTSLNPATMNNYDTLTGAASK
ncbi:uncharacterized protein LOC143524806 [Brachyhypopomus gauderio]|uniref:uncharacterized protein LOC143524806 n=1 Tax=Brachyhypopomus gauderio TaxID=698409 RepID=UPI004042194F